MSGDNEKGVTVDLRISVGFGIDDEVEVDELFDAFKGREVGKLGTEITEENNRCMNK